MYFYLNCALAFSMRFFKFIFFLFFFAIVSIEMNAQVFSTPDKFPQEVKAWMMESKFRDAFLIGDRWLAFRKKNSLSTEELTQLDAILREMPSKGFKTGELAYYFVRCFIQFDQYPRERGELLAVWKELMQAKDVKSALELVKQLETWQYDHSIPGLGSIGLTIHGKIQIGLKHFSFQEPQVIYKSGKDSLVLKPVQFRWDIMVKKAEATSAEIEGKWMGIPNGIWKLQAFEIIPRSGTIQAKESIWKDDGKEEIVGEAKLTIKIKAGATYFPFDFKANTLLEKPLSSTHWKGNGRLWISDDKRGLLGDNNQKASLELVSNDKTIAKVTSDLIWILPNQSVQIPEGRFKGVLGTNDSLVHARIRVTWNESQQTLQLNKLPGLSSSSLFFEDSYHKLRISADVGVVNLQTNQIDFFRVAAKEESPAWVESYDFFEPNRVQRTLGIMSYDPMRILYNYLREKKVSSAYLWDIATRNGKKEEDLRPGFQQFKQAGFIQMESPGDLISFTRTGKHYAQVLFEKKDFDQFYVASSGALTAKSPNVTYQMSNNQLVVNGVEELTVSDSLHAAFSPKGNQLVFTKGRDFDMDGKIKIGNYRFYGPDFKFNFSDFAIKFDKIDSITFFPRKKDGTLSTRELGGDLQYQSGSILLSPPNNKSGRIATKAFPKLLIPKGVTAYFNEDWRANGAYSKVHYFSVPSIELDSLLEKQITFQGTFNAKGLIPTIKTSLEIMDDQSFGFQYQSKTPMDIYTGKGKFLTTGPLKMDRKGLHGPGQLQLFGISTETKDTKLFPDSLLSEGNSGKFQALVNGKIKLPPGTFGAHLLSWHIPQDSLLISPIKNNFKLFQSKVELEGNIGIHQQQVFGQGKLSQSEGVFTSSKFDFTSTNWSTQEASFQIGKDMKLFKPAVMAKNIAAESDLKQQQIKFKSPKNVMGDDYIVFPFIAYQSKGLEATWDLEARQFKLFNKKGFELSAWQDDSTAADSTKEKGLIVAKTADYDLKQQVLNLGGVAQVSIGPAIIYPFKGNFGIQKDGKYKPFSQAKAVLDAINERHAISNLLVTDANADYFKGEGDYLLPRASGDSVAIKFKSFEFVEPATGQGVSSIHAKANFGEKNNLNITPHQWFKGEVLLESDKEYVQFKGFVRPNLGLNGFRTGWIPFEPKPGEEPKLELNATLNDENGRPVTAGIYINASNKLYPTFLGPQSDDLDPVIFTAEGKVTEHKDRFEILGKQSETQLFFKEKQFKAEGPIQFFDGNKLLKAYGNLSMSTDTLLPRVNAWLSLQFPFAPELLKVMGEKIVKYYLDEGPAATSADEPEERDGYLKRAQAILGNKIPEEILNKMDKDHLALDKVHPDFAKSINFSRVDWAWLPNTSAFYSTSPISLVNVGPVDINNVVKGYMEVIKKPNKEEFYGYWEISEDLWYFFAYFEGELGVFSSDNQFLAVVRELVKNAKKEKKDEVRVVEAAADEKDAFLKRFFSYYRKAAPAKKPVKAPVAPKETQKPKTKPKQGGF